MNNIQEKLAAHPLLNSITELSDFIEIFQKDISQDFYDLVEGLNLSGHFDDSIIKDYIDNNSPEKNEEHYQRLSNYSSSYIQLFIRSNSQEYFNLLDHSHNVELAKFYQSYVAIEEVQKIEYFSQRIDLSEIEASLDNGIINFRNAQVQFLYEALELSHTNDAELAIYVSTGLEESIPVDLFISSSIILKIKPAPQRDLSSVFSEVSSFFTVVSKNIMEHSAKIAITGALVLGVSMGAAMAGDKGEFDSKINSFNDKLASLQTDVGGDCQMKIEVLDHSNAKFTVKLTLGDEERVVSKVSIGSKNNSFNNIETLSKKTGKCSQLSENDTFKAMKDRVTTAVKNLN